MNYAKQVRSIELQQNGYKLKQKLLEQLGNRNFSLRLCLQLLFCFKNSNL